MVKGYIDELYKEHDLIWSRALNLSEYITSYCIERYGKDNFTDKEYYRALCLHSNEQDRGITMMIHKGKDPFKVIWRIIEPTGSC